MEQEGLLEVAAGLYGRTLGLLGFGNIGAGDGEARAGVRHEHRRVERDRRGDGPQRRANRPADAGAPASVLGSPLEPLVRVYDTPEEVAANCDILSVHLAANDKTRGIINAGVLGKLKKGAFFVNTARGEVVDYPALEQAVKERGLRVALDVYAKEPSSGVAEFEDAI